MTLVISDFSPLDMDSLKITDFFKPGYETPRPSPRSTPVSLETPKRPIGRPRKRLKLDLMYENGQERAENRQERAGSGRESAESEQEKAEERYTLSYLHVHLVLSSHRRTERCHASYV